MTGNTTQKYAVLVITFIVASFCISSCDPYILWFFEGRTDLIDQSILPEPSQNKPATEAAAPAIKNPNPAPPVENAAPPPVQEPPVVPPAPAAPPEQVPVNASPASVIGGWYGSYCDESEGTFYYRWSVDLMQNPADGSYAGTVKFHDCPEGGRAAYRVTGPVQPGPLITLTGVLKDGGGALYSNAAATLAFTFDLSTGQITPNLSP